MHREVDLPSGRSFTAIGDVRIDPAVTRRCWPPSSAAPTAPSSAPPRRCRVTSATRGRAAFDGDPATWWTPQIGDTTGAWVQLDAPTAASPGQLIVTFAADGRHSVPAKLSVQADGTTVTTVDVPDAPDGGFGTTRSVTIPIPAGTTATSWRLTVDDVHARMTNPWLGGRRLRAARSPSPTSTVSVSLPPALHDTVDTGCRSDLVAVDGSPVPGPGQRDGRRRPRPSAPFPDRLHRRRRRPRHGVGGHRRRPHHRPRRRPPDAGQRGRRWRRAGRRRPAPWTRSSRRSSPRRRPSSRRSR